MFGWNGLVNGVAGLLCTLSSIYGELWQGKEAGLYNDLGEFATFIVDSSARQDRMAMRKFKLLPPSGS